MVRVCWVPGILILTGVMAQGQGNGALRARELFYTPPPESAVKAPPSSIPAPITESKKPVPQNSPKVAPTVAAVKPKSVPKQAPPVEAKGAVAGHVENVLEKPPALVPLGLRYSVMKRDSTGKFLEVDPDSTFHSGDRIRLEVQANTTGYLYVVTQGSSGNWQVLFPSREVAGGSNQVHRGETRQIPAGGRGQFVFDEQAGAEKLFIVLARQPEQNLDQLIYTIGKPAEKQEPARLMIAQASVGDDVISRLRGQMAGRDLVFEKVENETVTAQASLPGGARLETAAYVVNPNTAADARVIADLKLKHE